jgi:hypothetical protein
MNEKVVPPTKNISESQLKSVDPIYGVDYAPGYILFSRTDDSFVSKGIIWFENQWEASAFKPSHVMIVKDENTILEANSPEIKETNIHKYFDDEKIQVVCRRPVDLEDVTVKEVLTYAMSLEGRPYDFTGIMGFALMISGELSKYIKFLRKLPVPFHFPGSRVCSSYVSDALKHSKKYRNVKLFREWHITRIMPVMLLNEFPFSEYKFGAVQPRMAYINSKRG